MPQLPAPVDGTVGENVRLRAAPRRATIEVGGLLERAGLDPSFAGRRPERLSVGEQQRVMLARALALDPEVLLLDEPTAALDEGARAGVEQTLSQLGTSMVLVTHDRAQAERLADRVVTLEDGRLRG